MALHRGNLALFGYAYWRFYDSGALALKWRTFTNGDRNYMITR